MIKLYSPFDAHLHLREGEMLKETVKATSRAFAGAMVMPNLVPAITTVEQIKRYKGEILKNTEDDFEPYFAFFLSDKLTPEDIKNLKPYVIAAKMYPAGATTNSDGGVTGFDSPELMAQLKALEDLGIPLSIHGETGGEVMDREREFAVVYETFAKKFPKLKILMEHISTKELTELVNSYDNLYATVTLHHLIYTLDDVIGGGLNPHNFCKPIIKTKADRKAIQDLVFSGHEKVFFGSDSAPHLRVNKEKSGGAAGIYSAPVALEKLAEFFDENGKTDLLQSFLHDNAMKVYNLDLPKREVILEKSDFIVPDEVNGVVPFLAGETIKFKVQV